MNGAFKVGRIAFDHPGSQAGRRFRFKPNPERRELP
jgi:hypothetical protein